MRKMRRSRPNTRQIVSMLQEQISTLKQDHNAECAALEKQLEAVRFAERSHAVLLGALGAMAPLRIPLSVLQAADPAPTIARAFDSTTGEVVVFKAVTQTVSPLGIVRIMPWWKKPEENQNE